MPRHPRTRPDGRSRTFENRYGHFLRQLVSEHFADTQPTNTEQTRLELAALISARIERLRIEMFENITDDADQKLIALTRSLLSVSKQLRSMKKRTERQPSLAEYLEAANAQTDDEEGRA